MKILIVGRGYIGQRCAESWNDAVISDVRIQSVDDMTKLIEEHRPDAILNTAGVTGKPNVDWCETNQVLTVNGNTLLPWMIAQACQKHNVYLLHVGTGCIFYGPAPDPKGWKEDDFANPISVYSKAKYAGDIILSTLPNVGIARIRLPIDYIPSDKNLITRFTKYKTILDVENSITVVEDMMRVFHELMEKNAEGIFHCTQKGSIHYRKFIELYNKYINPEDQKEFITEEELVNRGSVSKNRATNKLQSFNLEKYGIRMRETEEIVAETMKKYAEQVKK